MKPTTNWASTLALFCWGAVLCNFAAAGFAFLGSGGFAAIGLVVLLCGVQTLLGLGAIVAALVTKPPPKAALAVGAFSLITGPAALLWLQGALSTALAD
ncbi:MAG: hypothetical protein QM817_06185 [Archangium sp.]